MTRLRLLCKPGLSPPPLFPSIFFFFSLQTSYIFMRVLCVDPFVRPSIHPVYPYVRPLARPSARGTHARAAERARASVFCVGVRTRVHTTVYTLDVRAQARERVHVRSVRSHVVVALSVSEHAAHDIRRWGPCGHLISGDTRARASLLIARPDHR